MKQGFESRFSAALLKSLQNNGINPHGVEMPRIVSGLSAFFAEEFEENKDATKQPPQEPPKAKPAIKSWAERSKELEESKTTK